MRKEVFALILLILILFVIDYPFLDSFLIKTFNERDPVIINRIIDGDTVKVGEESVRFLGINTPEKGEEYYEEAKEYLENRILNKTGYLEYGKERYDRYKRKLAYLFLENKNLNLEIVENGLGNYYFPDGKDKYYFQFEKAWEECIEKNINLCEKSKDKCAGCISLEDFDYENEIILLKNICSFECHSTIHRSTRLESCLYLYRQG